MRRRWMVLWVLFGLCLMAVFFQLLTTGLSPGRDNRRGSGPPRLTKLKGPGIVIPGRPDENSRAIPKAKDPSYTAQNAENSTNDVTLLY